MNHLKLAAFLTFITQCFASNILYIIPFTSKSHYFMLRPIGLELARRGHNVTVITAFKETNPPANYHELLTDDISIWETMPGGRPNVFKMASEPAESIHESILWPGGLAHTEIVLNSKTVQELLLNVEQTFDLVISEQFYQESLYALAYKYSAPLVLVTTFGNCMRHNALVGNPLQIATVIPEFLPVENPTSFWGRLRVFTFTVYEHFWWRVWYMPKQEALVSKYIPNLPQPVPSLIDMQKNASLMLVNAHFSFDVPAAYLPNIVEIGGLHLEESDTELPRDLKQILDEAKHGVVYMNFGSNVRSAELPKEKLDAFLKVFGKLKQTVLWKWEVDDMPNKPSNVIIRKWMPQKEIFTHPNIKVFIAHGGLIGVQEATFFGVPIIGVPIYADQYNNLLQAEEHGYAKIIKYQDIEEHVLERTLMEVLKDEYKVNAKKVSKRFRDRPMKALDTSVWWIEYVIRNNGADYMKNPALKMNWIQYNMLDVYGFLFVLLLGGLLAILKIGYVLLGLFRSNANKVSSKKRN